MSHNIDRYNLYSLAVLNEGAYFFKRGNEEITKKTIEDLFSQASDGNTILTRISRIKESQGLPEGRSAYCSFLVIKISSIPSFLDEKNMSNAIKKATIESKLGYLLIVEIDKYVVIIKKNVSQLTSFIRKLDVIDGEVLSGILVDDKTIFQQMRLTNMNINSNGMRNKSVEANNLKNSMSLFGSNQSIVTNTRFVNDEDEICTLNISTSRLAKFGHKKTIPELMGWIDTIVDALNAYQEHPTFLSKFAKPISWKSKADVLVPNALLINVFELQNFILTKLEDKAIYRNKEGESYDDVSKAFYRLLSHGVETFTLRQDDDGRNWRWATERKKFGVAKNATKLSIYAQKEWDKLYVKFNEGTYVKLVRLINSLSLFSVSFDNCSYIYTSGRLYQNSGIEEDFDSILSILYPIDKISEVNSEKGTKYTNSSTDFNENSMFHVVETELCSKAEFLVCDDMGNEWADHIAIKGNAISFIHSKCKDKTSLSASNFQEVIGQAIKNIGNLNPNDDELSAKKKSWNGTWTNTKITKIRRGTVDGFVEAFKSIRINPNRVKEVCLAINFFSKSELEDAFDKIKHNETFGQRNTVIQMVWILNAFITNCKEADLHCKIYCRE